MDQLKVVGAIIEYNGKILCMQRNKSKHDCVSYKFEFPGGKVETGETPASALMRELKEEMDFDVNISEDDFFAETSHDYPDFSVNMRCYICRPSTDSFIQKEHKSHVWLKPSELDTLDWAEADIPIMKKIAEKYKD